MKNNVINYQDKVNIHCECRVAIRTIDRFFDGKSVRPANEGSIYAACDALGMGERARKQRKTAVRRLQDAVRG